MWNFSSLVGMVVLLLQKNTAFLDNLNFSSTFDQKVVGDVAWKTAMSNKALSCQIQERSGPSPTKQLALLIGKPSSTH